MHCPRGCNHQILGLLGVLCGSQRTRPLTTAGHWWPCFPDPSTHSLTALPGCLHQAVQQWAVKGFTSGREVHAVCAVVTLCCRLALAGVVASSAAYVTGKLAELVGHASYATALAIAKMLPGHKKKAKGEQQMATVWAVCALCMALIDQACCAWHFLQPHGVPYSSLLKLMWCQATTLHSDCLATQSVDCVVCLAKQSVNCVVKHMGICVAAGDEVTPEERSALHTVGAASLVAFVDVYDSLETAGK